MGPTGCTLAVLFPGTGVQYESDDRELQYRGVDEETGDWGVVVHGVLCGKYHRAADIQG